MHALQAQGLVIPNAGKVIGSGSGDSKRFNPPAQARRSQTRSWAMGSSWSTTNCTFLQSRGGRRGEGLQRRWSKLISIPSEDTAAGVSKLPLFFTYPFGSQGMPHDKLEFSGEPIAAFFFSLLFFWC